MLDVTFPLQRRPHPVFSVVVPAFNEATGIAAFHARLAPVMDRLVLDRLVRDRLGAWEVVYVDDGSTDGTRAALTGLQQSNPHVAVVALSRNFGKEIAITAGLDHATGDAVIVIDADLQDPPEVIPALVAAWRAGFDMVTAQRRVREGETQFKRATAHAFYRVMRHAGRVKLPVDTGDFRLMSRRVVDAVRQLREQHRFMKGLFAWVGFPTTCVLYDRAPRHAGETKWNYWRLWNLALEGITSFTVMPLKIATYMGLTVAALAVIYGAQVVVKTLLLGNDVAGYPSLMTVILFLGGVQLMTLGVMGEYLGRIFNETKQRPLYLVEHYEPSMMRVALAALLVGTFSAFAMPPPDRLALLRRGVNITGWFRFPASQAPDALAGWMSDAAMADLHRVGFSFVRLAVDPALMEKPALRNTAVAAVCRLQRQGLAVVISPHPAGWHLEADAADRGRLHAFWGAMAPALRRCDLGLTMPEVLNEPVFPGDPAGWATLQRSVLGEIRTALPESTVVLTGQDWGSIAGLLALTPEPDQNVVYSFHFYDPSELTALAAYRPGLVRHALAGLPFPVTDALACSAIAAQTGDKATGDMIRFYCASGWDNAAVSQRIGAAVAWARAHDAALFAGEFGATTDLNDAARQAWLRIVRETFEANRVGWALWGYDDIMGFAVPRPPLGRPLLNSNTLVTLGVLATH